MQARRSELWWCRDSVTQAGIRCLGRRKKKLLVRDLLSQTLSQHGRAIHGNKGKKEMEGWHRYYCLPVSSSSDLSPAPDDCYHRDHQRPSLWWQHLSPACWRCEWNVVLICAHLRKERASVVDDLRRFFAGAGYPCWVLGGTCRTVGTEHHHCAERVEG